LLSSTAGTDCPVLRAGKSRNKHSHLETKILA
jgi:hypothetical protein